MLEEMERLIRIHPKNKKIKEIFQDVTFTDSNSLETREFVNLTSGRLCLTYPSEYN